MTTIITAINDGTYISQTSSKSPDEICREIELGTYPLTVPMIDPVVARLRNFLLISEREKNPLLSKNQKNVLELLAMGASETEIARAMGLSYSGIRHHIESLKKKFEVSTREELIAAYVKNRQ